MDLDLELKLERIETGEISLTEARSALRSVLAQPDDQAASMTYIALRGWTGRALRGAHSADELRGWHELIDAAATRLQKLDGNWTLRLDVLKELVFERVGMAVDRAPRDIVNRIHVKPLLSALGAAPEWTLARGELLNRLELGQANLSRICTMLVDAGMIRRSSAGINASFELTALGKKALAAEADESAKALLEEVEKVVAVQRTSEASPWNGVIQLEEHRRRRAKSTIEAWVAHDTPLPALDLAA